MIWSVLIISLGLASARNSRNVSPEYLESLRASGQDEEFAKLLGVDVSLVRPNTEERAEGSMYNFASALGDILLSEEQERQGIDFEKHESYRWKNNEIPFVISYNDFNTEERRFIFNATLAFNEKVTNLKLVPRSWQDECVFIVSGNGCWSYLGTIGGAQPMSLQKDGCLNVGTIQHEFIHAAGFTHEHNRNDRDDYCKVLWDNIPQQWQSQYQKVDNEDFRNVQKYDYYSVMHYPIWAPGNSDKDAFEVPPHVDRNRMGQIDGVTEEDCNKINEMYS